jgi:8-oxo-dGTP pyrophosphatase MutT (NUDIX family)
VTKVLETVAWVERDAEGRVLMVRPRGKPLFFMPGGKKEPGEDDVTALARELKEELDVDLVVASVQELFVVEAEAWGRTATTVRMVCFTGRVEGTPRPSAEIEELAWLGPRDLDRMPPAGRKVVENVSRS